ncbi:MAG TPA: deoxyribodipyrimidine photo-lyase, partial [Rhizomicrobium sp.]|nr:deoxyribodipyrimidine photo-lyase [Rhizomicrobium sp.]
MQPVILWFRQDLRLSDNPALSLAAASGKPVVPLFVLDDENAGDWKAGGASRWWLHHSLAALAADLKALGVKLILRRGPADKVVQQIVDETKADAVMWNRCYEPWSIKRDTKLKADLTESGIDVKTCNASLLQEPWEVKTKSGGVPFKVYTPFWRTIRTMELPPIKRAPKSLTAFHHAVKSDALEDWKLLPNKPDWAGGIRKTWTPGEDGAKKRLSAFLKRIDGYSEGRDRPDLEGTSRLSPHLHFGEISPRQIWHAVSLHHHGADAEKYLSEIGWREFSNHLLFHNPELPREPLDPKFVHFPWSRSEKRFDAWCKGQTGVPMVDAGMRQLWHTGWMHNRVRMIAASYLIKHLAIDWRRGEQWFWDTLVDADLANNSASWQWVAGCGADAAPFFRIFNPVLQGEKFDPDGLYVREWVPEIAKLP